MIVPVTLNTYPSRPFRKVPESFRNCGNSGDIRHGNSDSTVRLVHLAKPQIMSNSNVDMKIKEQFTFNRSSEIFRAITGQCTTEVNSTGPNTWLKQGSRCPAKDRAGRALDAHDKVVEGHNTK